MKCRRCGAQNPPNVNKCIYCGTSLVQPNHLKANANVKPEADRRMNNNSSKKARSKTENIIISIIAVLGFTLVVLGGIYFFAPSSGNNTFSGGGGGGGIPAVAPAPEGGPYTVTFDLNYSGAQDGPEKQEIKAGELVHMPNDPERENFIFVGWHKQKDKIDVFDFDSTITNNYILYAHWIDISDMTDTDGEGLIDSFEKYFGTDINAQDTDGDGLNDLFELEILKTDPLKKDTDDNGVTDNLEDADGDGLNNEDEFKLKTNAVYYDTDHDLLSDYDEVKKYNTDPLKDDTDDDGAKDGDEIAIGSDPLAVEKTFITKETLGEPTESNPITVSVTANTDGEGAGTLEIEPVTYMDNHLISNAISGYLGCAYNFSAKGKLEYAEVAFLYDKSLGTIGPDFQPRIYYLNEKTGEFEELPNQTVTDGKITVRTSHFSIYILLNKTEFDKVWDAEIRPAIGNKKDHLDIVLVMDSSGSMVGNDPNDLRKSVAKNFVSKIGDGNRAAIVDFDGSAKLNCEFNSDINVLNLAIDNIDSSGKTDLSDGIGLAIDQFNKTDTYNPATAYKFIVMLTDGQGSYDPSLTTKAKDKEIIIYTVGLGNGVDENILKAIAEGTGGQYFFATKAEGLEEIFQVVLEETIDYTTDSNNDGITDYYTKLLNDGRLVLTNTSTELALCTDIFGEDSDDWDGDGIKNGDEISVVTATNGKPGVLMKSHPFYKDTDNDGYSDYEERYEMKTDPFQYTIPYAAQYNTLKNPDNYYSAFLADDYTTFEKIVGEVFDWDKTEQAQEVLVDYFYTFASQESIEANAEKIERQAKMEGIIESTNKIIKILKDVKTIGDTTTNIAKLDAYKERVDNFKFNVFKGLPKIFECANKKDTETAFELIGEAIGAISGGIDTISDYAKNAESYLGSVENATGTISSVLSIANSTAEFFYRDGKMINIPIPKAFNRFSVKYQKWMGKEAFSGVKRSQLIGMAFDMVDFIGESAELYTVYAKIEANTEAYEQYLDAINYISTHGNNVNFVRDAAGNVMKIVLNNGEFMQDYIEAVIADTPELLISIGTTLLSKYPCVAVFKAAVDLGLAVSGLTKMTEEMSKTIMADSISDAFIAEMSGIITSSNDSYISVLSLDEANKCFVQICQSRIYAEDVAKGYYEIKSLSKKLADWLAPKIGKMTSKEMIERINKHIETTYSIANELGIILHNSLPTIVISGGNEAPPNTVVA